MSMWRISSSSGRSPANFSFFAVPIEAGGSRMPAALALSEDRLRVRMPEAAGSVGDVWCCGVMS